MDEENLFGQVELDHFGQQVESFRLEGVENIAALLRGKYKFLHGRMDPDDVYQDAVMTAMRYIQSGRSKPLLADDEVRRFMNTVIGWTLKDKMKYVTTRSRGEVDTISLDDSVKRNTPGEDGSSEEKSCKRVVEARGETPYEIVAQREEARMLAKGIEKTLAGHIREVVSLRVYDGHSPEEVAEKLNISVGAVNVIFCRAKSELTERIRNRESLYDLL